MTYKDVICVVLLGVMGCMVLNCNRPLPPDKPSTCVEERVEVPEKPRPTLMKTYTDEGPYLNTVVPSVDTGKPSVFPEH